MNTATDLFDFIQAVPPPVIPAPAPFDPRTLLPPRPVAWDRLVTRAPDAPVRLFVCPLWTGVCLEVLSAPQLGRKWLDQDGTIRDFPPDSSHCRMIYLTPEQLAPIRQRARLTLIGTPGTSAAMYAFGALQ